MLSASVHYLNQCWPTYPTPYDFNRPQWVNTLRPRHNGRHFPEDISNPFSRMKTVLFRFQFHWMVQLTIIIHQWFRRLALGTEQATNHCLNQVWPYIYIYIYIYYCWKSPNSSHLYDHAFMDVITTQIVRKSVNQNKYFKWFTSSRRITLKTIQTQHNQSKRPVTMYNVLINTTLLHRCSYTSEYNAQTRFLCMRN